MKKIFLTFALLIVALVANASVETDGICYDNASVNQQSEDFSTKIKLDEVSTIIGDADGNFNVSVNDVTVMISYLLGQETTNFIFENADIDHNGIITVTDIMSVVNIVLGKDINDGPAPADDSDFPEV